MKNKKLIDLYKEWMEKGIMGKPKEYDGGLCNLLPPQYGHTLSLIRPTNIERRQLKKEGLCDIFWASGIPNYPDYKGLAYSMSDLRQNIILLICAIHNEL